MTITLELSADQERTLEEGTARRNANIVRQVLIQAIDVVVSKLLDEPASQLGPADFDTLLDSLATDFADSPALSDEAVSRAGIYADHP